MLYEVITWFALRLSSGLSKLVFFYIRFPKTTVRGTRAVMVPGKLAPFTFFNLLFISPVHLGQPGMQGVLEHELAHIRKWHSMDVLAHRRNEVGVITSYSIHYTKLYEPTIRPVFIL